MTADHAARAVELTEQAEDPDFGAERTHMLAAAQVHATLALAEAVGRSAVQRPRWDDDLRREQHAPDLSDGVPDSDGKALPAGLCYVCQQPEDAPDHPEIVTERGQERPGELAMVVGTGATEQGPEQAHSEPTVAEVDKFLRQIELDRRKAYWSDRGAQLDCVQTWLESLRDWIEGRDAYRARQVDDPTHTNPITVHGIPAEDHHAHVCPVCRVREEKP